MASKYPVIDVEHEDTETPEMESLEDDEDSEEIDDDGVTLEMLVDDLGKDETYHRDNYQEAADDLKFFDGDQWDDVAYQSWIKANLVPVVNNRIPAFCHQVENDIRQNTPSLKALPADSFADIETAEIIQDLFRNTEYVSQADIAYDTAATNAVRCGIGFLRLDHDYTAPDSFEQHVLICEEPNPLSIYLDCDSIKSDGSDARRATKLDVISDAEFKRQWPNAQPVSLDASFLNKAIDAFTCENGYVIVGEQYRLVSEDQNLLMLSNGLAIWEDEYEHLPEPMQVIDTRPAKRDCCYRYKFTANEILQKGKFPASYIPIIPVYGEIVYVDGKRKTHSLFRNAKDAQRLVNQWSSRENEALNKAPKAPWIAAEGQLEGYEDQWRNPDAGMVLPYKPVQLNGLLAPPPARVEPAPVSAALIQARMSAVEDMKATIGIYNADLGNGREADKSGRAILAEQNQGAVGNFHFADNLKRGITQLGRVCLNMYQHVIDTPRMIRIMGEDGTPKTVPVNGGPENFPNEKYDRIYDISVGKYDVVVTTGPSYASKRIEASQQALELAKAIPQIAQFAPDLIVKTLDIVGAQPLADRLKKSVPPQFLEGEEQDGPPDLRPQLAQAEQGMQIATQHIQQMQQAMQQLQQELQAAKTSSVSDQLKAQSDQMKYQADVAKSQVEMEKINLQREQLGLDEKKLNLDTFKTEVDAHKTAAQIEQDKVNADKEIKLAAIQNGTYLHPDTAMHIENIKQTDENVSQAVQVLAAQVANLTQIVNTPKTAYIVRDAKGTPTAVTTEPQTVQ